eukprot:Skav218461  [mRNA]  locus=scaffold538:604979:606213:+ [translate_table: standard]
MAFLAARMGLASVLCGSVLWLQGCGGSSRPVYAPQPPSQFDYAFKEEMSSQIRSLRDEVRSFREQKSQNEEEIRKLKQSEADLAKRLKEFEKQEQEIKRKEEEARNYPVPEFLLKSNHLNTVNIAITGDSGTGKSHLNNVIRMEPTMYQFPNRYFQRIWDLPGAGTPKWPMADYIKKVGLRHFDAVLLVCAERFTEADLFLMKIQSVSSLPNHEIMTMKKPQLWPVPELELERHRVPYFAVRQKMGQAIQSNLHVNGVEEEETKREIRDYMRKEGRAPTFGDMPETFLAVCEDFGHNLDVVV